MKPRIDLNNPLIQHGIDQIRGQIRIALEAPQKVESAVIPLYTVPKTKGHRPPKVKPEQIGSGVLVRIKDEYFIFSATHVFLDYNGYSILTGAGNGEQVQALSGERLSSGRPEAPLIDKYDASVFHIQSDLSDSLKQLALTLDDFDLTLDNSRKLIYMAAGFRSKKSNTAGKSVNSKRECFPSIELNSEHYSKLNIDSKTHMALAFEKQVLADKGWQLSPIPRGISGGAIIKVEGADILSSFSQDTSVKQLLAAITTEYHPQRNGSLGYLLGTRIIVHLGLIYQDMPHLLEDFLASQAIDK